MKPSAILLLPLLAGAPAAQEPEEVDFATLSAFDFVPGMTLPKSVTRLHKKKVTVSGFMLRETPGSGPVEYFMLINDAYGCQGTPKLNEIIFCATLPGQPTPILPGIVEITGTLYVGEQQQGGEVVAIYVMDADKISQ